jgi:uncharacterized membrane protein
MAHIAWNVRYSVMSYIRSSLWIVPVFALFAQILAKRLAEQLGSWMVHHGWYDLRTGFFALTPDGAKGVLERIFTINLSCLVFTFGSLLVAIQVAGGQYTPRIIATTLLRDNVIRWIVGWFVFTTLWSNRTLVQLGQMTGVPQFQVFLTMAFGLASVIVFIMLIDYAARLLRPVSLVRRIGEQGIAVIESVYPHPTTRLPTEAKPARKPGWRLRLWAGHEELKRVSPAGERGQPDRIVYHAGRSMIVLALHLEGLVSEARRADCVIEFAAQVGDFVAGDEPLFYLYGNASSADEHRLRECVAFGPERTMEQDPMFAFRIEVDFALKALSAAINDPTTAVLAIDQLHRLLRLVGKRSLRDHEIADPDGRARVVFRTPNWEDFVNISFREIRLAGAGNLQIARRLRAMIENLLQVLPEHRHPELIAERDLLDRAIARHYVFREDEALARIADTQGLGGASSAGKE